MEIHRAPDPTYVMGYTARERERLQTQGDLFRPFTGRFLRAAGLADGMRILDVGCGVGDVSLLCAEMVGPSGTVVGVDRDPTALARARQRTERAGLTNARFREADFRELSVTEVFDAVVGRAVLMYTADPAAALRSLLPHVRLGGIVAFQELDYTNLVRLPPLPLYNRLADWWMRTAGKAGIELQMGFKLLSTYQAAGLPAPELQADILAGGGSDYGGYAYLEGTFRSILPLMERFGLASADEVGVETLADRLREETVAGGGVISLSLLVGASTRKP